MTATKDKFFNPAKLSAQEKAAVTDHTARTIIAAEATEREKKTARLRALRMQQEPVEAPPKPTRKSSKRPASPTI
ncbi:hypothetical protein [Shinella sp.]|uniref:hypothetical protein n=1 Tax=Shinella sp. TaxID=1870904 RepID=UPI003D26D0B0